MPRDAVLRLARASCQFAMARGGQRIAGTYKRAPEETSALRRSVLDKPLNGRRVILDVGYADTIPDSIRKPPGPDDAEPG